MYRVPDDDPLDTWVLPGGALGTARAALGLTVPEAVETYSRGPTGLTDRAIHRLIERARWRSGPLVPTGIAVFASAGLAVAGRTAGSSRPIRELILDQKIRRQVSPVGTVLGECMAGSGDIRWLSAVFITLKRATEHACPGEGVSAIRAVADEIDRWAEDEADRLNSGQ